MTFGANYPIPFTERTRIRFALPEAGSVTLAVYDVLGRRIHTLVDGEYSAGWHAVSFEVDSELPAGVYVYRLRTEAGTRSGMLTLAQ